MGGPNVGAGGAPGPVHPGSTSMLHQSFKNPNWPPNFINADNVLEYFCDPGNVFFDPSSCNQHLKMQNLNRPLQECLESMTGTQYALVGANPPLFVIVKQRRNSSVNVTPLCYYYIVNGTVYQCPDMYTFVQSKLIGAVDSLRRALEQSRQFSRYNVAKGYYWEFKEPTKESVKTEFATNTMQYLVVLLVEVFLYQYAQAACPCPSGQTCYNDECREQLDMCLFGTMCPEGYTCVDISGQKTCIGSAPVVAAAPVTTTVSSCVDLASNCAKNAYLCTNTLYRTIMVENCARTCGICN